MRGGGGGGGGGRGGSSDFFHFTKFQGVQHMLSKGGGGQTFFQGGGVQLLSDRTCDLYWTPVPALDLRNYQEF